MKALVNIDIGGTFTDCFVTYEGGFVYRKTPTTTYNLSVGFLKSIEECAQAMKMPLRELLQNTEMIRYSTTIAMNRLIERKGPLLGLMITEGFEDTIYIGRGSAWADGLPVKEQRNMARAKRAVPLIPKPMTVGIKERVEYTGKVLRPLDEEDTREKIRYLVGKGARGIVVSLLFSYLNASHEQRIKEIFMEEFPDSYLGNVPIVLSSEVLPKRLEYTRTMTTVLNAYLHQSMSEELGGMWDVLRDTAYTEPLMMVHNTGGMAKMFRTTAVNTYNGGPVAGVMGGLYWGGVYKSGNVIVTDMGGTSFDIGIIVKGSMRFYQFKPVIDRWLVDQTMLETRSIGAGGGSIAKIHPSIIGRVDVGPESNGSNPGPACYNQGGTEATVTDADVVLGYIDPNYFHGGKKKLNAKAASEAIKKNVAEPLGWEIGEAAAVIKDIVDGNMGNEIYKETVLKGYDPREFVLLAFGGAGPTHCCGYEKYVGTQRIVCFPFSPVFCAFGSSIMDLVHLYEQSSHIILMAPSTKRKYADYDLFNRIVDGLKEKATRDFESENVPLDKIIFSLELDMKFGGQLNVKRTSSPRLSLTSEADIDMIIDSFIREYSEAYSPLGIYPEGGVIIENFVLRGTYITPKIQFPKTVPKGADPRKALVRKREVFWRKAGTYVDTPIFREHLLECGNLISGPAVVEAEDTSIVIPEGWSFRKDEYLNGILERSP